MTFINPINVNTQGVAGAGRKPENAKTEEKAQGKAENEAQTGAKPQMSADQVLDFMAASSVGVRPTATKTIDPAKYVDAESADRIAGFMASFEDKVAEGLAAFDKEFANVKISDDAKMNLVLASIGDEA